MFALILLFILVVAISFFLALYSMHDFEIKPNLKLEYGTFLVKNPKNLNPNSLAPLFSEVTKSNLLISFERLFKGHEGALVVYGPKNILMKYQDQFNFLELEDYTKADLNNISIWEVEVRDVSGFRDKFPNLGEHEQIWFQIILSPNKKDLRSFPARVRVVLVSKEENRLKELTKEFQNNYKSALPKIPKPYSKDQIFEFYQKRSFIKEGGRDINLKMEDILNLWFFL